MLQFLAKLTGGLVSVTPLLGGTVSTFNVMSIVCEQKMQETPPTNDLRRRNAAHPKIITHAIMRRTLPRGSAWIGAVADMPGADVSTSAAWTGLGLCAGVLFSQSWFNARLAVFESAPYFVPV